jgi:hypothetical protein
MWTATVAAWVCAFGVLGAWVSLQGIARQISRQLDVLSADLFRINALREAEAGRLEEQLKLIRGEVRASRMGPGATGPD